MSLKEHLLELRKRLFIAGISIVVGTVIAFIRVGEILPFTKLGDFYIAGWVWAQLRAPVLQIAAEQGRTTEINYSYITESFDIMMGIAIGVGVIMSSPVWLYQIWAYFAPAMQRREKRYTVGFFLSAVPLFLAGCAVGWFILPNMVGLMTGFAPIEDTTFLQAKTYLDFTLKLILAIGIAFVLPVFLVLLNFAGVISAISILKGWRIAILLIAVFTALATPAADIISMFMLMAPMILLYFTAWAIAWVHDRRAARRLAAFDAELAGA
ncbi:MAG: twin-arginine translocase subunit TatC [Microbacteriaceae bacterium]